MKPKSSKVDFKKRPDGNQTETKKTTIKRLYMIAVFLLVILFVILSAKFTINFNYDAH